MINYDLNTLTINGKHSWFLEYYDEIVKENIVVGRELRKQLENLIEDLSNEKYIYDNSDAELRIEFIETFVKHTKSPFNGEPFILELWEKAVLEVFYSFKYAETKLRRFKKLVLLIGRKNGKSTFCAAISFAEFLVGDSGSDIVCSSNDDAQANLIFNEIANMRQKFDAKSKYTHKNLKGIFNKLNDSTITKLSEKTQNKEGRNINAAILDEAHEMKTNVIAKSIEQSQSTKEEPIFIIISTEGFVEDGYLDHELEYGRAVLNREIEDDELLVWLYTMDSETEIYTDRTSWQKANPSLGKIKKYSYLEGQLRKAQVSQADRIFVLSKDFNIKQNSVNTWLMEQHIKNNLKFDVEDFRDWIALAATDLSETTDLTSARILLLKKDSRQKFFFQHYFIPESKIEEGSKEDGIDYLQLAKEGFITVSPGNEVDYSLVVSWYLSLYKKYGIRIYKEGHDRWNAKSFVKELDDYGIENEKITQDYMNLSNAMKSLEADLKSGNIVNYNMNPVDIFCLKNTGFVVDKLGRIMPTKALNKQNKRIDGSLTMIMCYVMLDRYKKEYMDIINYKC